MEAEVNSEMAYLACTQAPCRVHKLYKLYNLYKPWKNNTIIIACLSGSVTNTVVSDRQTDCLFSKI